MTDREMLKLAAKVAGIEHDGMQDFGCWIPASAELQRPWNPLADDGDALRLAVKPRFTVAIADHEVEVFSEDGVFLASEPIPRDADPYAATRRAIVRAAAVARGMGGGT